MKYLILLMFFGLSISANEMDRIEAIITDIEQLRKDYNKCINELGINNMDKTILKKDIDKNLKMELNYKKEEVRKYKSLLSKEKTKNTLLIAKLDIYSNDTKKPNNKYKELLLIKEKEKKSLINEFNIKFKNKENRIKYLESQINSINKTDKILKAELVTKFKAKTFRLNNESNIYDATDGKILFTWDKGTSFTSGIMTQNWIKITGYFLDNKWSRVTQKMWIKKINASER